MSSVSLGEETNIKDLDVFQVFEHFLLFSAKCKEIFSVKCYVKKMTLDALQCTMLFWEAVWNVLIGCWNVPKSAKLNRTWMNSHCIMLPGNDNRRFQGEHFSSLFWSAFSGKKSLPFFVFPPSDRSNFSAQFTDFSIIWKRLKVLPCFPEEA